MVQEKLDLRLDVESGLGVVCPDVLGIEMLRSRVTSLIESNAVSRV